MAECARSPLHAPLEPADDKAIGNGAGSRLNQRFVISKNLHGAALGFDRLVMLARMVMDEIELGRVAFGPGCRCES